MQSHHITKISLQEALLEAHTYRGIHDDSPLVTISLHRLLLAVIYRCWSGMTSAQWAVIWEDLWSQGRFPTERIEAYRQRWEDRFDLFDNRYPFYQVSDLTIAGRHPISPITRLAVEHATGNNATLFDHHYDDRPARYSSAFTARKLLATQAFAVGGGVSGAARLYETIFRRPYSTHGPLTNCVVSYLQGATLFHTLMLNLVPVDVRPEDLPPWEFEAAGSAHEIMQRYQSNHARSPIEALTWQSRLIRLWPDSHEHVPTVSGCSYTQGRSFNPQSATLDPMLSCLHQNAETHVPLRYQVNRDAWYTYLRVLSLDPSRHHCPASFDHVSRLIADGRLAATAVHYLNMGGVTCENAKVHAWRLDTLPVPPLLFTDHACDSLFADMLDCAERMATRLRYRLDKLATGYLGQCGDALRVSGDSVDATDAPSTPADRACAQSVVQHAAVVERYWRNLAPHVSRVLAGCRQGASDPMKPWSETVTVEAYRAYDEAYETLGRTARAIRATGNMPMHTRCKIMEDLPNDRHTTPAADL